jgi:hypothetical protein
MLEKRRKKNKSRYIIENDDNSNDSSANDSREWIRREEKDNYGM